MRSPCKLLFSNLNSPNLLSLSSKWGVLQSSCPLCDSPLDLLQQLMLGTPEQDTILKAGSHKSRGEGKNHLSLLATLSGCSPGHIWTHCCLMLSFLSTISPQVFLHRAPLNAFSAQSVDEFWGFCDPDIGPCTLFY